MPIGRNRLETPKKKEFDTMKTLHLLALLGAFSVAACGQSKEDRAASGGLIGAGAGAVIGSTMGLPVTGAAVGAGVGAATGALADPSNLNLGKPIWK
jgi:uncharacterized membrane protein